MQNKIAKNSNLDSDFSRSGRLHLDVSDVKRLLGFPGHSGLAGDGLAVGGPQGVDECGGHVADSRPGHRTEHVNNVRITQVVKTQFLLR